VQFANPVYRDNAEALIRLCAERDVGTMIIKAVTRGPWGDKAKSYTTWYEPFDEPLMIQQAVNFALSQNITGLCTSADTTILPMFLEACEKFSPLDPAEQEEMISSAIEYEALFV
jgi:hypothetical protein